MSCRNSINADCGWILKQFPSKYGSSFDIFWYPAPQLFQKRNQIPLDPRVNLFYPDRVYLFEANLHFRIFAFCLNLWLQFWTLTNDQSLRKTVNWHFLARTLYLCSCLNFWISDQEELFAFVLIELFAFVLLEHPTFGFPIRGKSLSLQFIPNEKCSFVAPFCVCNCQRKW